MGVRGVIYLDNAATSFPKPPTVLSAMQEALRIGASPARGTYRRAVDADRLLFSSREAVAQAIGAMPQEVVFTKNATEAINLAMFGLLGSGDEFLTTDVEHNAVWRPARALARHGAVHRLVPADPGGTVPPERFAAAITKETKLVVLAHASNVLGGVHDVASIALAAHHAGALVLLDASQTAGERTLDVRELGVDLLAAPGHKGLLGPPGTGILYISERVGPLRPLLYGGTGGHSEDEEVPRELPDRLESGTLNLPAIAGLGAAARYHAERGEKLRGNLRLRTAQLAYGLVQISGLRLLGPGPAEERAALCSFTVDGEDPIDLARRLDDYGIAARAGLHCAPMAHAKAGTLEGGAIRLSPGPFTTERDIEEALAAIEEVRQWTT